MYRVLMVLKGVDGFISGEKIGEVLGISRAGVWKGIKKLRQEGYEIEAITNKGYRLISHDTVYNKEEILVGLETQNMGRELYFFKETDSTNNQLKDLGQKGAKEGTLAIAETMTHGRGRSSKHWTAPAQTGIWMSLLLRPEILPHKASVLTLLAGLAVSQAIEEETGVVCEIKWPNDILINGKKIVGILMEMDCEMQQTHFIVLGIGINVNTKEFPEELQDIATSLYQVVGHTFSRKKILQKVLLTFEKLYTIFLKEDQGFRPFLEQYENKCVTLHREIRVLGQGKVSFLAQGIGITPEGELKVKRMDTGKEEVVFSGEVSIGREMGEL